LLSELTETVDTLNLERPLRRGDVLTEWKGTTPYLRYADAADRYLAFAFIPARRMRLTCRPRMSTNERGEVISDVFTDPVMRKKMVEKRMRKIDHVEKKKVSPSSSRETGKGLRTRRNARGLGSTYNLLYALQRRLEEDGTKTNYPDDQSDRAFPVRRRRGDPVQNPNAPFLIVFVFVICVEDQSMVVSGDGVVHFVQWRGVADIRTGSVESMNGVMFPFRRLAYSRRSKK